jgi:threonine dehydrogenase-like Zn-dependent dehydrogenase
MYAREFGATRVLNPLKEDVPTISKKLCETLGPNVVFDCAGVQQSMDTAFAAVRVLGTIVNLAMWKRPATVNANIFLAKQLKWIGSAVYAEGEFQEVIDAIESGQIEKPERLITSRISLEDSIIKGFDTLLSGNDKDVKILVSPEL